MADAVIELGVVIERREIDNPWQDFDYRPVAVFAGAGPTDDWRALERGDGWTRFHAATLPLELFRGETEGYKSNLAQDPPSVYVVLRPGEEADEADVEPFLITVCPYEAAGYTESGDELVEGVTMPAEARQLVEAFVEAHHVDEPFKKRKRKGVRREVMGRRPGLIRRTGN